AAPVPALHPRPDTHTGLRWMACGVARTTVYEDDDDAALRLCANATYQGPLLDVTGVGFEVVYHASAARPDEPAAIAESTFLVPGRLTVVTRVQVLPCSVDADVFTLASVGSSQVKIGR